MHNVKEIVKAVRDAMVACLSDLVSQALADANMAISNEAASKRSRDLNLINEREAVLKRFAANISDNFDGLTGVVANKINVLDYASLSLVEEADLEAIIAMEGMISHARNCDISQYLSFTTRLDSLFYGTRIDESNNPMDPEQLGEAFRESLRPLGMTALELLISYRKFNSSVFHDLEKILKQANSVLIDHKVLPDLDMAARSRSEQRNKRSARPQKIDPTDRAFSSQSAGPASAPVGDQQLLSLMQKLLHSNSGEVNSLQAPSAPQASVNAVNSGTEGMMVGKQKLEVVANDQLLALLNRLQPVSIATGTAPSESQNLRESVDTLLEQEASADTLPAIDSQSSDIINLVTIFYEEIWNDRTVPIPIKELIGRTQITILKIALKDPGFFDSADHPAREFLNEIAIAGISWTGSVKLDEEPLYDKMQELVSSVIREYDGDLLVIERLLADFIDFRSVHAASISENEQQLVNEDERKHRLHEVEQYALHKIEERILDVGIDPFVTAFLQTYFHKFVVQVVLREGPGGISWRPIMNTIDVLLWTVSTEKTEGDLQRFAKVNPRLLVNLGKALDVAGIEKEEADEALEKLKRVQEACFKKPVTANEVRAQTPNSEPVAQGAASVDASLPKLPDDDEHLLEVEKYPIGTWLEFQGEGEQTIRCTLAAKIVTIGKYIFVNRRGVKVVEKSKMGLARELKAGTAKVICGAPLVDRAMESVIARLRKVE